MVGEIELDRLLQLVCLRVRELIGARVALRGARRPRRRPRDRRESRVSRPESRVAPRAPAEPGPVEGGTGAATSPERPRRLVARRPGGRAGRGARDRGPNRPLRAARRRRGSALGVIAVHDKLGQRRPLLRRRPAPRRDLRRPRSRRRLALGARRTRHRPPGRRRTGIGAPPSRARTPRRDGAGADVDPARRQLDQSGAQRRGGGTCRSGCPKPRRPGAPRRTRARGRAPAGSARRLRSRAGARAPRRDLRRTQRHRDRRAGQLEERLSPEVEITLYRVVQEALTNVVKHSGAEHVSIVISNRDGGVAATIDDDGRGFDSAEVASRCARPARHAGAARARRRDARGRVLGGIRDDDRRSGARARRGLTSKRLDPSVCREQRGDLVQRARASKARDPHDVLADEADLDRGEPPDARLGAAFDDEVDDRIAGKREGVPARGQLDALLRHARACPYACRRAVTQMTGNVLRMDSRLGRRRPPAIRDRPRVDCGFLRMPPPAVH